ncbi:MAG: universal stress protein [Candidatus Methanoperedens nitroreducens]|uniref:Universal stress protein n=1 Tax=Candidatus Methanoperedens nitratireducens TaxID=1392998 RepID=A0A0P7ZFY6_9EURY|nr:universal stress protein [Candidatus Methanoperedens sp. BLZ2]KAB2945353.1 MAG: universal stress protein [Candidatus Methanoperedens sp.]KPQ43715.1 MAG: universal stress protein [Candidatus Methanoperedens sp. BLZ1]MBZ0177329.1 universal stress protein [Candidatus Methanoperedens nitroreducens]CAG0981435.1 Stress response protein NhaX [Methanosarcinales archaeon]MCX9077757.1 universal stress protein [Candidatus Methanoperedens sp.]
MASKLYEKILIATDGSEYTKNAVDYGIDLAKNTGAKLLTIFVVDTAAFASIPMDAAWESMYELLRQEGDAAIKYVIDKAKAEGVEAEGNLIEGHPADEIIKYSEKNSVSVIIMGTLGKSGLDRFLLGSVAEKVVRNSKIPVLVVHAKK